MATVPGSGAILKPIFNQSFGIREVVVENGGSGYTSAQAPILTIENCGIPTVPAVLWPVINDISGKIVHVRVLESGRGYDPLRLVITPLQDSAQVDTSTDISKIAVSNSYSLTSFSFQNPPILTIKSNNLPDPAPIGSYPGMPPVLVQSYHHNVYYRGGREVPSVVFEQISQGQIGILSNGTPISAPILDGGGNAPTLFDLDAAKYDFLPKDQYSGHVTPEGLYTYHDARFLPAWREDDSVSELGPYYQNSGFQGDHLRHPDGHSKILGISYDGYPIYGPYGYANPTQPNGGDTLDSGLTLDNDINQLSGPGNQIIWKRMHSSYRHKQGVEIDGNRPLISGDTTQTTTFIVSVGVDNTEGKATGVFYIDGAEQPYINLERGRTYIFDQNDPTNEDYGLEGSLIRQHHVMFSATDDGEHEGGDHYEKGVSYWLDGVQVSMLDYVQGMADASDRYCKFEVPVDAPSRLYYWCHNHINKGNRVNVDNYPMGAFTQDYIWDETIGDLDTHNGRFCITPDFPSGTYAYFLTIDESGAPQYPYCIGQTYFGDPALYGDPIPTVNEDTPEGAKAEAILNSLGAISYVKMISSGDGYFGPSEVKVLGGGGTGAQLVPVTQSVTGLSISSAGREYASSPKLIFQGGGGTGAEGVATIDTTGILTNIVIDDPGQFYQEAPYVLIQGGGGKGAKGRAVIDQGVITNIEIEDPGSGYTNPPSIIFTKLVNVKRVTRNRVSFNSSQFFLMGLVKSLTDTDPTVVLNSTASLPGSGTILINRELIRYTSKSGNRLLDCTRGTNFRYDQRVVLDTINNTPDGISQYQFNVGDRIVRRIENQNNKVAKVYDWNNETRELFLVFEVDELAFIDAGRAEVEENIVSFDAGLPSSANQSYPPHVLIYLAGDSGESIPVLTEPIGVLENVRLEDDDENDGEGDGIPDLVNTGTDFENQISLDGGLYNSLYGLEETQGGQNTTLLAVGDQIKDASIPFRYAGVAAAGGLYSGTEHVSRLKIQLDLNNSNLQPYQVGEIVEGDQSLVRGTVEAWDADNHILTVINPIPYDTGNALIGDGGIFYTFSHNSTVVEVRIVSPGLDYTAAPTVVIENAGDVQATATATMTASGDQVSSITVTAGGYGYEKQLIGSTLHPTVTFTNDPADTTGSGAVGEVVLGGERLVGTAASWRIKTIEYDVLVRDDN